MAEQTTPVKKEAAAPVEAVKNCTACNKPMKKAKRFYRDGKYYCNKRCWKTTVQKTAETGEALEATEKAASAPEAIEKKE